jgi:penicillin-binding protein 1A
VLPPPTNAPHVPPPGVVEMMINPETGAKLAPGAPGGVREYFDTTKSSADETPLSLPIPADADPPKLLNDLY